MKLYFALSAASVTPDGLFPNLVRVAVYSALTCTSYSPVLIFDGAPCSFTDEIGALGAKTIFHKSSLHDAIRRTNPDNLRWQRFAAGTYLRLDIPVIEETDEVVLYADCDVVFLQNPPSLPTPRLFAAAPERQRGNHADMNAGVMLINVPACRDAAPTLLAHAERTMATHIGFDQGALRRHFAGAWEALPETMNWKPYWGRNDDACIVHFHGPKPTHLVWLLTHAAHGMPASAERLFREDPHAYAHYLGRWFEALAAARFATQKVTT